MKGILYRRPDEGECILCQWYALENMLPCVGGCTGIYPERIDTKKQCFPLPMHCDGKTPCNECEYYKPVAPFMIIGYYMDDLSGDNNELGEEQNFDVALQKASIICEEGGRASVVDANGEWFDP